MNTETPNEKNRFEILQSLAAEFIETGGRQEAFLQKCKEAFMGAWQVREIAQLQASIARAPGANIVHSEDQWHVVIWPAEGQTEAAWGSLSFEEKDRRPFTTPYTDTLLVFMRDKPYGWMQGHDVSKTQALYPVRKAFEKNPQQLFPLVPLSYLLEWKAINKKQARAIIAAEPLRAALLPEEFWTDDAVKAWLAKGVIKYIPQKLLSGELKATAELLALPLKSTLADLAQVYASVRGHLAKDTIVDLLIQQGTKISNLGKPNASPPLPLPIDPMAAREIAMAMTNRRWKMGTWRPEDLDLELALGHQRGIEEFLSYSGRLPTFNPDDGSGNPVALFPFLAPKKDSGWDRLKPHELEVASKHPEFFYRYWPSTARSPEAVRIALSKLERGPVNLPEADWGLWLELRKGWECLPNSIISNKHVRDRFLSFYMSQQYPLLKEGERIPIYYSDYFACIPNMSSRLINEGAQFSYGSWPVEDLNLSLNDLLNYHSHHPESAENALLAIMRKGLLPTAEIREATLVFVKRTPSLVTKLNANIFSVAFEQRLLQTCPECETHLRSVRPAKATINIPVAAPPPKPADPDAEFSI